MDLISFVTQSIGGGIRRPGSRALHPGNRLGALTIGLALLATASSAATHSKAHPKSKPPSATTTSPHPADTPQASTPAISQPYKYVFDRSTRIVIDQRFIGELTTPAYWIQVYLCRVTGYSNQVVEGMPNNGDLYLTIDDTKSPLGFTLKMMGDAPAPIPTAAPPTALQSRPYMEPAVGTKYVRLGAIDGVGVLKGAMRLMGYLKDSSTITADTFLTPPHKEVAVTRMYQINAGGQVVGTFDQDAYFWGTESKVNVSNATTFDTSGAIDPAPPYVYQSERSGEMQYVFPYLKPGVKYLVRLHFSENFYIDAGKRIFNVSINGSDVLKNFDIVGITGRPLRAVVKEFTVAADGNGQIAIAFSKGPAGLPKISGIEILYVD